MEEKIIIDGVDVSECPHINAYNPNKPICQMYVGIGGSPSECRGNCAYIKEQNFKQLEQENEKLKNNIDFWQKKCADADGDIEKLSEENARLKEEIKNSPLCVQCKNVECEIKKLRDAIAEIEKIIENLSIFTASDEKRINKILQIINSTKEGKNER